MDSQPIVLVVCNLYPFEAILTVKGARKDIIENIDIGGVALMRAAAKNFDHVMVISDPTDYVELKKELKNFRGCTRRKTRKFFAGKAFSQTSYYDHIITGWFLSKKQVQPFKTSGNPVRSLTSLTFKPSFFRYLAVPPVEIISTAKPSKNFPKSLKLCLSLTLINALRIGIVPDFNQSTPLFSNLFYFRFVAHYFR